MKATKPTKKSQPTDPDQPATPTSLNFTANAVIDIDASAAGESGSALPRFKMLAYTGAPMRVGGWRYPVIIDLAGLSIPSQSRPIRFGHDPLSGVGHTDAIRIEQGQLMASGVVSRDTPAAREVVISSKNGFPWQASIGASVEEFEFVKDRQTVTVNGRQYDGPLNVVRKASLGEISFVDLGADGATSASVAAQSPSGEESMDESSTVDHDDTQSTSQTPTAPATPPANDPPASPPPAASAAAQTATTVEEIRAAAAAEVERIGAIRRQCGGRYPDIEARAIRDGWSEQRTELEILRITRPVAPSVHVPDNQMTSSVLEAACMMTAGLSRLEDFAEPRALDAASRRFKGGIGLQELMLEAAWANGYTGRTFRDPRAVFDHAFSRSVQASFSTIDLGGILSNVANKFLLEGFFSVERTWRNICAIRNVSDFKTVTSYRMIGKEQYEQVAPGGELKHGTLGEEQYSNKADTYGLMLSIDRRDIVNDDLGAITTVPRKLGRGSGLKINDIFWSTFMDNASFFTAGNNNYISGATTGLSIDGLTQGEVTFMDQTDADGKPIGVMPAILLVPTALSALGSQLFKSMELRDTTSSTKYPVSNPHQGKFRVEVSRYLSNSQYTGNSAKAWFLLAEPTDLPVIEVAFLNGQEAPTIETADADFNVLGVQMRGYHDFGVALQDPRGGLKSKGEA
ncbi:phage major capsid protein [Bremerella sp. P1]|uniref:phage major capsid protein n=1 Tax=Bremerella sp. P1 TaxID=3026424 RepID=UPI002367A2CC|nr:hypothetical protein [Bremerella sp. P1]WDI40508.1 hypothetical protein PSR63_18700 [Bremerella sp. P1]